MALQDVCGFTETFDDTNSSSYQPNEMGYMWRTPFEFDRESSFNFHLPAQQSCRKNTASTLFSSTLSPHEQPFHLSHGTTTLGFIFQDGVIAAADTRASCKGLVCCPITHKIMPIHSHLVVNTSGSGADCMLWERILTREMRLYQLRHRTRLSINGAAKLLSTMLHPFKGTNVCVAATLCGWDGEESQIQWKTSMGTVNVNESMAQDSTLSAISDESALGSEKRASISEQEEILKDVPDQQNRSTFGGRFGPRVCYVCSDGLQLNGEIISVGSGSPYAYAVLDDGWRWGMTVDEAVGLAREAVFRATHWDAYSGNNVDLFYITARGWRRREREDLKEEYYREREREREKIKEREEERQKRELVEGDDDDVYSVQCG
ncbi:proteasome subunit beta type-11a [Danio rerio]|uniref:Novel protein similar to proteasomes n=1 Tax=Danio rerio TaxID=7955 RepID=B0R027_DANRE|nr:proteasome subunit beta type-11a [Danio rerio]CAQ14650.1 novel protein similar to proteasomes [Danio rerio]|eukprot:NP_001007179.1 proteasome subunit beta type-11 [Danio rerio]